MAPRNRSKKGKGKEELPRSEYAPPTQEEFLKMKQYNKFSIPDAEGNLHPFSRFETATILPDGISPGKEIEDHKYWVAKIVDIRGVTHADDDSNDVWVEVRWYYSPEDVAGIIKSLYAIPPVIKMPSDHYDIVSVEAFNEAVKVYELKDDNLDQQYIPNRRVLHAIRIQKTISSPSLPSQVQIPAYAINPTPQPTMGRSCTSAPAPTVGHGTTQDCLVKADFTAIKVKAAKAKASSSTHPSPSKSTASTSKPQTTFAFPLLLLNNILSPAIPIQGPHPTRRPGSTSSASSSSITLKRPSAALKVKSFARISPLKSKKQTSSSSSNLASRGDDSEEDEEAQAALSEALDGLPAPLLAAATQPIVRAPKLYIAGGLVGTCAPLYTPGASCMRCWGARRCLWTGEEKVLKGFSGDGEGEGAALGMEGTVFRFKGRRGAVKGCGVPECGSAI
ncbi:hypothetical protein DFP72DRAFT_1138053 [Ephemerocybe angulata]|uniref:BAH domain-containing protein n=1 Tax=Ephemerocybe angulata TaxID=980116 RepID=A0A8H6HSG6_9AGAR|nr:hypothetical protein DFP72DRAFT_1138053 [Tulosesus angulatus]